MRIWAKILRRRTLLTFSSGDSAILRRRTFSKDCYPKKFGRVQPQVDNAHLRPGRGRCSHGKDTACSGARPQRVATEAGRGQSGLRPKRGRGQSGARRQRGGAAAGQRCIGAEMQLARPQRGAAAAGQRCCWARPQWGAVASGRSRSGAQPKRGADTAGWVCGGEGMRRGGPSPPHSSVPLSAALRRKRVRENKGSLPYPPFRPLSLSLSHLTSSSPWMNNPPPFPSPQPTSSSLYGPSESPHSLASPLPSSATSSSSLSPFTCPFPFPSPFPSRPSPFLTLPFPFSHYPCDLPQPCCLSLKGQ